MVLVGMGEEPGRQPSEAPKLPVPGESAEPGKDAEKPSDPEPVGNAETEPALPDAEPGKTESGKDSGKTDVPEDFGPSPTYGTVRRSVIEEADFINTIGINFVYIEPGSFMMGSPEDEQGRFGNETQHRVTLTRSFHMQTTEVTQGQRKQFVADTGYIGDGKNY